MQNLEIKTEYITLGQFLKISSIIQSGGEAKYFLQNNTVLVNNLAENRRGRKLFPGDFVEFNGLKTVITRENVSI